MVLPNETSLKIEKEVSSKYHKLMEMHIKMLIRSRKCALCAH